MKDKSLKLFSITVLCIFILSGCVDQSGGAVKANGNSLEMNGKPEETDSETVGRNTGTGKTEDLIILATSMATVAICEKLDLPLDGIPDSNLSEPPKRYKDLPRIGLAMSPDMEIVASMNPDWILSPVSLISDLKPKYEAIDTSYAFLNLSSVAGMYKSIEELGILFDREEEARILTGEFENFYNTYKESHKQFSSPSVLILMGLPGSYVAATEHSYVGSLVKMAGAVNVYREEGADFITANTEDMLKRDPDIILRTAHALPEEVMEMFSEEFKTNDIWKNFRAVKEEKVYDLPYDKFGMSATFDYPEALNTLDKIFYEEAQEK